MDPNRQFWNQQQKALRKALSSSADFQQAINLFLSQHAMVHSARGVGSGVWAFEDEVWQGVTDAVARQIPTNGDQSMVWNLWHIARIEDITLNMLVAGSPQLFHQEGWLERLRISHCDTGNGMHAQDIAQLSASIDVEALRAYRSAVGCRTRQVVQLLQPEDLKRKVRPDDLQRVVAEGAVLPAGKEVLSYWGGLTVAGLLLMPPTRHNFIHLNEALRIKQKVMQVMRAVR